jgi:hypothetical protein
MGADGVAYQQPDANLVGIRGSRLAARGRDNLDCHSRREQDGWCDRGRANGGERSTTALGLTREGLPAGISSATIKCLPDYELTYNFDEGHRMSEGREWAVQSARVTNLGSKDVAIRPFSDFIAEAYGVDGAYARSNPTRDPLLPAQDRLVLAPGQELQYRALVPLAFRTGAPTAFPHLVRIRPSDSTKPCDYPQDLFRVDSPVRQRKGGKSPHRSRFRSRRHNRTPRLR